MKHRTSLLLAAAILGTLAAGMFCYTQLPAQVDTPQGVKGKANDPLPIRQIVLFNSGIGYFQREGEVDGDARVQLSFPTSDINDLLKSLVLQDARGHIGTVNYDSSDPIDKILRSFALDLTHNPSFGQILNQARGEKIEITRGEKGKVAGAIIGVETQKRPAGKDQVVDVEILNLNTATGLQAIPMEQIVAVRFMNPVLESEFQRALSVLATSHDTQKKSVSVGFQGQGKRAVRVGYVVERPIWKTTYRLRMDNNNKVFLQGWALVENTSDDDWNDVRMVLVSGKPISFRMNLYDPLYIPRPFVEPEMFASLRPPVYSGAMGEMPGAGAGGGNMGMMGMAGMGMFGNTPQMGGYAPGGGKGFFIQPQTQPQADGKAPQQQQEAQAQPREAFDKQQNKLTYEELQRRRQEQNAKKDEAKKVAAAITGFNFKEGIQSVATAEEIGDYYQYNIKQNINLPRQKSAMLPILDQTIEGHKVSIFNESIHNKYPLLGLKLKNTSGQPLTQGPITVYDDSVYGGDTRILDLQPNEERLLSYALDQGTEVKTEAKNTLSPDLNFQIGGNTLTARFHIRQTKTYTVRNRSTHDRQLIIEHPLRADWKLIEPKKPAEKTRDLYRFQIDAPRDKTVVFSVVEDQPRVDTTVLQPGQPSYAVATGIGVKIETHVDQHKLVGLKILKGFVRPTYKVQETKAYFVQNLSDLDRTFTVDHIVRPGWTLLDDKTDGAKVLRFKLTAEKGKTAERSVREERNVTESGVLLKNLTETAIRDFLTSPVPSADVKAGLAKALGMQSKIAETQKQLAEEDKQLKTLNEDQARVRENLKIIPMSSEHYKKFLEKFVAQETQIESYQRAIRELTVSLQTQTKAYDQYLAKLDAE